MTDLELKKIALRMVEKGYVDRDVIRYMEKGSEEQDKAQAGRNLEKKQKQV